MNIFVMMPFQVAFDSVYKTIKNSAAIAIPDKNLTCIRLDELKYAGAITNDLLDNIQSADLCIADITNSSPNVMWEVGFASALQKPIIIINQNASATPFNIKDMRVQKYDITNLKALHDFLVTSIIQTLEKYEIAINSTKITSIVRTPLTIAATGSRRVKPNPALRRISALITPYLNNTTTWLCGTNGIADEIIAEELLTHHQRVIAVATSLYRISINMAEIIKKYKVPLINAQDLQLPEIENSPGKREVLFQARADIIMLFWDRQSPYTLKMIEWYQKQGKDCVLGYI